MAVLDDGFNGSSGGNIIVIHGGNTDQSNSANGGEETEEEFPWARYTPLLHLGSTLRSDPGMTKALLSVLSDKITTIASAKNAGASTKATAPF